MPNWCQNRISASGSEADIAALMQFVKNGEQPFDFNKIVPIPDILNYTRSGSREFEVEGQKITLAVWYTPHLDGLTSDGDRPFTKDEQAQLDEMDVNSWYDWCTTNWGTKWNACHCAINIEESTYVEWTFDTAWSPPVPVIEAVRERFPDVSISAFYDEPGMQIAGYY